MIVGGPRVTLVTMRSKDDVRADVWQSMDREGVSRFPGAEGRIPNFAGAKAAAELLGLPFSTYRGHLTRGVERIVEWLWQRELYGQDSPAIRH